MAERVVLEPTGQARIVGEPDLPGALDLGVIVEADVRRRVDYLLMERIMLEVRNPARFVHLASASC